MPINIAYKHTPALHISTLKPSYPLSLRISGAIYAGVPHYSDIFSNSFKTCFETPKSQILIFPFESSNILSNLMSL